MAAAVLVAPRAVAVAAIASGSRAAGAVRSAGHADDGVPSVGMLELGVDHNGLDCVNLAANELLSVYQGVLEAEEVNGIEAMVANMQDVEDNLKATQSNSECGDITGVSADSEEDGPHPFVGAEPTQQELQSVGSAPRPSSDASAAAPTTARQGVPALEREDDKWAGLSIRETGHWHFVPRGGGPEVGVLQQLGPKQLKALCKRSDHKRAGARCLCWLSNVQDIRQAESDLVRWLAEHGTREEHILFASALKVSYGMRVRS